MVTTPSHYYYVFLSVLFVILGGVVRDVATVQFIKKNGDDPPPLPIMTARLLTTSTYHTTGTSGRREGEIRSTNFSRCGGGRRDRPPPPTHHPSGYYCDQAVAPPLVFLHTTDHISLSCPCPILNVQHQ